MKSFRAAPLLFLVACAGPAAAPSGSNGGVASTEPSATAAPATTSTTATAAPSASSAVDDTVRWHIVKSGHECRVVVAPGACIGGGPCGPATRPIACLPGVDRYPADVERKAGATECTTTTDTGSVRVPCPDAT